MHGNETTTRMQAERSPRHLHLYSHPSLTSTSCVQSQLFPLGLVLTSILKYTPNLLVFCPISSTIASLFTYMCQKWINSGTGPKDRDEGTKNSWLWAGGCGLHGYVICAHAHWKWYCSLLPVGCSLNFLAYNTPTGTFVLTLFSNPVSICSVVFSSSMA